ncbi:MAG: hypothetical protein ABIG84_01985 [archaeon]
MNISSEDIKNIKKTTLISNLKYYIATAVIAILTFILGFFAGSGTCPVTSSISSGYPFAGGLTAFGASASQKRTTKIAGIILVAAGFFIALKTSPIFGEAIKYNVFSKYRQGGNSH